MCGVCIVLAMLYIWGLEVRVSATVGVTSMSKEPRSGQNKVSSPDIGVIRDCPSASRTSASYRHPKRLPKHAFTVAGPIPSCSTT